MTVDERKMAIAYADLLNIQELVQHILRMDADELFNPAAKKAFAQIALQLDMVMACVAQYVARHTEFNKGESAKQKQERNEVIRDEGVDD